MQQGSEWDTDEDWAQSYRPSEKLREEIRDDEKDEKLFEVMHSFDDDDKKGQQAHGWQIFQWRSLFDLVWISFDIAYFKLSLCSV